MEILSSVWREGLQERKYRKGGAKCWRERCHEALGFVKGGNQQGGNLDGLVVVEVISKGIASGDGGCFRMVRMVDK
ncbi:hypothetical protein HPP92_007430 [Vanilla planifolia]|uniref:Uncharacterized protein n=1 Tax=Vanilla planifolia TaxID=51239 RepID=A0A835V9L6_VANPL|nr:hypothetical protein HPP92_007430 [Vanilla planifolia]